MSNPVVMISSGVWGDHGYGYGELTNVDLDYTQLRGVVTKTTTLSPKLGNPEPRLYKLGERSYINSVGLANPGVRYVLHEYAPSWERNKVDVWLSIYGSSVDEWRKLALKVDSCKYVNQIEMNLGCPNLLNLSHSLEYVRDIVSVVCGNTEKPVSVKISPVVSDFIQYIKTIEKAGASYITIANSILGMHIDTNTGKSVLGAEDGGVSGDLLRPINTRLVYKASSIVDIPIIGVGGIFSENHAYEYILAGAKLVQVGSAVLNNHTVPWTIQHGLKQLETKPLTK